MHHLSVKSNLVDSSCLDTSAMTVFGGSNQPLCPKPRRLGPPLPEFLNPQSCNNHSKPDSESTNGVPQIADKGIDGRDSMLNGCYPACFSGSPPGRTHNPLVHDVHFINLLPPLSRSRLSNNF